MRYLGMDVHAKSTVWCLVNDAGTVLREGRVATTAAALTALVQELGREEAIVAGQEVGTLTALVHDTLTAAGVTILSFNAQQLRMIAASRKKTDRRDAYWLAKALQAGMYPHPVYVPTGEIRELRALLSQRRALRAEYNRWRYRARTALRAAGCPVGPGRKAFRAALATDRAGTANIPASLATGLARCRRQEATLRTELAQLDATLRAHPQTVDAIGRLQTVPGIGWVVAATLYAWVGDVTRFPRAKALAAYAGLVPTVRQSGGTVHVGGITKQGAPVLRATLIQAAHVLVHRCRTTERRPCRRSGCASRAPAGAARSRWSRWRGTSCGSPTTSCAMGRPTTPSG